MQGVPNQETKIIIEKPEGNGLATAALVLGILGLVLGIIPFFGWIVSPLWLLAIIFGAIGARKKLKKGQAVAGMILGAATIVYKILFLILMFAGIISSGLN